VTDVDPDDLEAVETLTRAAEQIAWRYLTSLRAVGLPMRSRRYQVWIEAVMPDGSEAIDPPEVGGEE
jgi:hypothetical protein